LFPDEVRGRHEPPFVRNAKRRSNFVYDIDAHRVCIGLLPRQNRKDTPGECGRRAIVNAGIAAS
jgi:hypothetical protein